MGESAIAMLNEVKAKMVVVNAVYFYCSWCHAHSRLDHGEKLVHKPDCIVPRIEKYMDEGEAYANKAI